MLLRDISTKLKSDCTYLQLPLIQLFAMPKISDFFVFRFKMSGLDSAYVKEHLDGVLTELIAELVQIKPDDPIEWLANALRQHSRKQQAKVCQIHLFEKKINDF